MRALACLRIIVRHGFHWAGSWLGRVGFTMLSLATLALSGDPLLVVAVVGVSLVLMLALGAFRAWDESDQRAVAAEKRESDLQQRVAELERQPQQVAAVTINYVETQILLDRERRMVEWAKRMQRPWKESS